MVNSEIRINGRSEPLVHATVADLVAGKGVEPQGRGVAVAVNGQIVPRTAWPDTRLAPGDAVEIVRALKGG
ncbi:sulfur carrier protein ThiS [Reyranella sp. CPCC 100927]|nr:sulfur carrier protein ThiS [Reyranella sp. CPCC 100927]